MTVCSLQPEFDLYNPFLAKEGIQLLPDIIFQKGQLLKPDGVGHADPQTTVSDPGRTGRHGYGRPDGIPPHAPDQAILPAERQVSL
jgi:hypothetical protein